MFTWLIILFVCEERICCFPDGGNARPQAVFFRTSNRRRRESRARDYRREQRSGCRHPGRQFPGRPAFPVGAASFAPALPGSWTGRRRRESSCPRAGRLRPVGGWGGGLEAGNFCTAEEIRRAGRPEQPVDVAPQVLSVALALCFASELCCRTVCWYDPASGHGHCQVQVKQWRSMAVMLAISSPSLVDEQVYSICSSGSKALFVGINADDVCVEHPDVHWTDRRY